MAETAARTGKTLVIGQYYWGIGDTLAQAKAQFRREGGKLAYGYQVAVFDKDTSFEGVDGMGRFYWKGNEPTIAHIPAMKGHRS